MVYFLLFRLSSIRTSVSFLASSRRHQSVVQAASSGQEWTGLERSAALHWLGPAKIAVNQDKTTSQASQPAQEPPSSAQATAEAGEQLRIANNSTAEEQPRSAGGQQLLDRLPQPSSAGSRAHPAASLPALPGRDAWLHSQDLT